MRRRRFLERAALLGAIGLAGCVGSESPDDGPATGSDPGSGPSDSPTDTDTPFPTEEPTPTSGTDAGTPDRTPLGGADSETPRQVDRQTETPTKTPPETPTMPDAVTEYTFEVTDSSGGQQRDSATVSFDADASTVTVSGTIWGSDACQTARLDAVELTDGELTVRVREATESDQMCAQVIVEVDYEATLTLDALPETVVVTHDHGDGPTRVASASR